MIFFGRLQWGFCWIWHELDEMIVYFLYEEFVIDLYVISQTYLDLIYVFLCVFSWRQKTTKTKVKNCMMILSVEILVKTKPLLRWTKKAIHINWNLSWRLEGREGGGGFEILWNLVKLSHDGSMWNGIFAYMFPMDPMKPKRTKRCFILLRNINKNKPINELKFSWSF